MWPRRSRVQVPSLTPQFQGFSALVFLRNLPGLEPSRSKGGIVARGYCLKLQKINCHYDNFLVVVPPRVSTLGRGAPKGAPAFFGAYAKMPTYIYIDGFNFYYGAVRGTPYKWLDFMALFTKLLKPPKYEILSIKYFTALVSDPSYH